MTPGRAASTAVTHPQPCRVTQCGVALSADAGQLAEPGSIALRLCDQLAELARSGMSVALRLHGLEGRDALRRFYAACRCLRDTFAGSAIGPLHLEVTITAGALPLLPAWRIRRTLLGDGTLNVIFESMRQDGVEPRKQGDEFWRDLWHLRSEPVCSVFWPTVRSACALLSPEAGNAVLPGCGLQAPEQSAWVRAELDVTALADEGGRVDHAVLEAAVAAIMTEADCLIDATCWPTAAMQHDAWYNRRVAIVPVGIGDIAKRRHLKPECHRSLVALRQLLAEIRALVEARSRANANEHGRLPSISASNPCLRLPNGARESCWQQRWQTTLERQATRHRNLLVLSPWSLFPRQNADFRYANFLPLLAQADACEFRRNTSLASWTASELKLFHCRAWALNNALMSSAVIADQP